MWVVEFEFGDVLVMLVVVFLMFFGGMCVLFDGVQGGCCWVVLCSIMLVVVWQCYVFNGQVQVILQVMGEIG